MPSRTPSRRAATTAKAVAARPKMTVVRVKPAKATANAASAATKSGKARQKASTIVGKGTNKAAAAKDASKRRAAKPASSAKATSAREIKNDAALIGPINTFARAVRFLNGLSDFERRRIVRYTPENFNLDRMRTLCRKLGNPQEKFKVVHVAGTKGKGSTCAMVASMLQANGYKVGLYASPHLVDVRERICVDGEMISQADFARLTKLVEPHITGAKLTPTYFDVLTAIAFQHFAEQGVDFAVVETGLGGRLDSTNVVQPEVAAITSVSKDHCQQLGNTLAKIATEKAGIFKPGADAVTVVQDPEVEQVLRTVATQEGVQLAVVGGSRSTDIEFSYRFEASRLHGRHNLLCLFTPRSKFEHLPVPMVGEHQAINCGLALAVVDRLKARGIKIDDDRSIAGLAQTTLAGRMETIHAEPQVIVDAAHNPASVEAFMKSVGQHCSYDSMIVIFGCCTDKDVDGMLAKIISGADKVIFTRINSVRSADPHDLAHRYGEQHGKMAQVAESLEDALTIARRSVTKDDLICITGSFYLVGQAKKLFADRLKARQKA